MSSAAGAASKARSVASFSTPQLPTRMTARISRLTTGSIQARPVRMIKPPATATPTEIAASAAMCRKAERTLRSCSLPRVNRRAVSPLVTTPARATPIINFDEGAPGEENRSMASRAMKPQANTRITALARAARTVALP